MKNDLEVTQKVYIKWTGKWSEIERINQFLHKDVFGLGFQPFVIVEYYTKENIKSISGYFRSRLLTEDEYRIWNRRKVIREINK